MNPLLLTLMTVIQPIFSEGLDVSQFALCLFVVYSVCLHSQCVIGLLSIYFI